MRDESMDEDSRGEAPCEPNGNYRLCRTHPTCEMVRKMLADKDDELKARGEILDTVKAACGEGWWYGAADWRTQLRDFAEDADQHRHDKAGWDADHETFPGVVLYALNGFYVAYHEDAAELWGQADDTLPMFHVMVQSDPPHRTCIHRLHLADWLDHLANICLPVSVVDHNGLAPESADA